MMENEQEYIMQINALSTSLNVGTYSSVTMITSEYCLLQDYHLGCVSVLEDLVKQLK